MDGRETVGNSLGRAPLGGSEMEATTRVDGGETVKIVWGERDALRSRAVGTGFQYKFHQCDCPENFAPKTFQVICKRWAMGHIAWLAGSDAKNALLLAPVFQDKLHQHDCSEKLCAQDLPKFSNPGPCTGHA